MKKLNKFIFPSIEVEEIDKEDIVSTSLCRFGDFEQDENIFFWTNW